MRLRTARPRAQLGGRTDWYRIRNAAGDDGPADVYIYDEISWWGTRAQDFAQQLREITASEIRLRLNSPGGDVVDGIAIHNLLRSHSARVTTVVDSLAASIASVIALAGDQIIMQPHSQMMIHDPWGMAIGNATEMREAAVLLDRHSDNIASVYAERAGGTVEDWRALMRAETWFTAEEAVAAGLADEVATHPTPDDGGDGAAAQNSSWDLSIFRYAGREHAPTPVLASLGRTPTTPPAGPAAGPTDEEEDDMSTLSEGLRQRLGIEDAELDEEALLAALDEALAERADNGGTDTGEPVAAALPPGAVAVDEAMLNELREQAAQGVAARTQQIREARDHALNDAIRAGKFPPARRDHWAALWDADPEGTRQTLASLAEGLVPLEDIGEPGGEPTTGGAEADAYFDAAFSTPGR
ncbi:head maturation protease, ClpP-related [Sphaerisporangium sp. NPDC051011]|uniref:head maturation protease, ClpP-related n=1 Tax=Sphaerisporangium sp. NPDC051011 TaxID=3155792 RepID=UPI0033DF87E3